MRQAQLGVSSKKLYESVRFVGRFPEESPAGSQRPAVGRVREIQFPTTFHCVARRARGRGHSCRMQWTEELLLRTVGEFAFEVANEEFGDRSEGLWQGFRDATKERE